MNTDMAPARPALRDVGALLRHADEQARLAAAMPVLVRQRLAPDGAAALREDDLSLTGGFVDAIARHLVDALCPSTDGVDTSTIAQAIVLADNGATRMLYARAIEARLCRNAPLVGLAMAELPPRVEAQVGDAQDELAEAAMALIIAQSRFIGNAQGFTIELSELPPESVSALVQRMLAWLQERQGADPIALRTAADTLLAAFDERRGRPHRLMRFCHLYALPRTGDDWSLGENGPSLVFAMLARASGLPVEHVVDMVRDPDLARFAVLLRACDIAVNAASGLLEGVALIASSRLDTIPSANALAAIGQDDAARIVAGWRNLMPASMLGPVW
ncbi:hypothetical protein [Blastomonas aquatica]|uniref:DUF2336 domain-containing protein n=1 Tax=Blastomonas aquatica TaxID=1510276 RepID=A0ABQ1JEC2_9SPHN|nr:hypothetical protein [Blastomonas aquatica]GGB66363.1 hypothetical protein GCM10010833_21920 [Blastomonas aquatica]